MNLPLLASSAASIAVGTAVVIVAALTYPRWAHALAGALHRHDWRTVRVEHHRYSDSRPFSVAHQRCAATPCPGPALRATRRDGTWTAAEMRTAFGEPASDAVEWSTP